MENTELTRLLRDDLNSKTIQPFKCFTTNDNDKINLELKKRLLIVEKDLFHLNEKSQAQSQLFDLEKKEMCDENKKLNDELKVAQEKLSAAEKFLRQIKIENDLNTHTAKRLAQEQELAMKEISDLHELVKRNQINHEIELKNRLQDKDELYRRQIEETLYKLESYEKELGTLKVIIEKEAIEKLNLYRKLLGQECELDWLRCKNPERDAILRSIEDLFASFLNSMPINSMCQPGRPCFSIMDKVNFIKYELQTTKANDTKVATKKHIKRKDLKLDEITNDLIQFQPKKSKSD